MNRIILTCLLAVAMVCGAAASAVAAPGNAAADGCLPLAAKKQRSLAHAGRLAITFKGRVCPTTGGVKVEGRSSGAFSGRRPASMAITDTIVATGRGVTFATGGPGFRGHGHRVQRRTTRKHAARVASGYIGDDAVTFDGAAAKVSYQLTGTVRVGGRVFSISAVANESLDQDSVNASDPSLSTPDPGLGGSVGATDPLAGIVTDPSPLPPDSGGGATGTSTSAPASVKCWDGSTAPSQADCPPVLVTCWNGTKAPSQMDCPPAPVTCWNGSTAPTLDACPPQPVRCWDGSTAATDAQCPPSVTCWDGSLASSPAACPPQPHCANGQPVNSLLECGSPPVAVTDGKTFNAGSTTHLWHVTATDPDADIASYVLVSSFASTFATFTWNSGTGQFTVKRPTPGTGQFKWKAIDSKGNVSGIATFTVTFA